MSKQLSYRGHRKFGDPEARAVSEGLRSGDPGQISFERGPKGVFGSARDCGRAVAAQLYRREEGIPISPDVFVDTTCMDSVETPTPCSDTSNFVLRYAGYETGPEHEPAVVPEPDSIRANLPA